MNYKIEYVDTLPKINNTQNIILLDSQKENLASLWFEYMQRLIAISLTSDGFKAIGDAIKESGDVHLINRSYAKNLLGIGDELSVINITLKEAKTEINNLLNFEELVNILYDDKQRLFKRVIIDRFFAYLWTKGVLLYPIANKPPSYQRAGDWRLLCDVSEIYNLLDERYNTKEVSQIKPYQQTAIFTVLASTLWRNISDVKEHEIVILEESIKEKQHTDKRRVSYILPMLSELRLCLIDIGREDILRPQEVIATRKNYSKKRRFAFVDIDVYPKLKDITQKAILYYDVLKADGLAKATIDGEISSIVNFIQYLMKYFPDREIDVKAVDEMFEPQNEINLFSILSDKGSAKQMLNKIIKFLVHCELYSTKAKKNTPKPKNKVSYLPYREAMPQEMVQHIVDIIKNRPPLLKTKWDRKRANISWWKHEVYPVYPMMMLFGYYIPVRGEQVRNLCRKKSFIIKEDRIDTIIINTDKNVNRKYYQEIPCVWDDLQQFVPFLKWHKNYYKNIPLVQYHDDDNSPWDDIEPIFNTPQILKPVSRATHFAYHKKILCQYQLEVIQKAKDSGDKYYPKVAWAKDKKEFFKSIEELNRCSVDRLKDIKIMYDLHSLRVTGATRYLESGVGINLVMQLTGHVTPHTLLKIYTVLTPKEKKEKLKSAVNKIYFGESDKLLENTADLIAGELVSAYEKGKGELESALKDNALFSINSKVPLGSSSNEYKLGVEIAKEHHPYNWFPMVHGICPAVKCPSGREHRCSICPYLITGKLFIDGVMLKANQSLGKFQRDSIQKSDEQGKDYKNQSLAESLEITLEEILGWQDILERINDDIYAKDTHSNGKMLEYKKGSKSAFAFKEMETELTYLSNAYDARMIGVEQDRVGLKILTIKAMKIANAKKDDEAFNAIAGEEMKSIDYLVSYYTGKKIEHNGFVEFIENIKKPLK